MGLMTIAAPFSPALPMEVNFFWAYRISRPSGGGCGFVVQVLVAYNLIPLVEVGMQELFWLLIVNVVRLPFDQGRMGVLIFGCPSFPID